MKPALVIDELNFEFDEEQIFIKKQIDMTHRFYNKLSDNFMAVNFQQTQSLSFWKNIFQNS